MHYAIIRLGLTSSVPLWKDNAKGTNLTEECAGIDTQFFGGRAAIATISSGELHSLCLAAGTSAVYGAAKLSAEDGGNAFCIREATGFRSIDLHSAAH